MPADMISGYIFKVWLLTILVAPLLFIILTVFDKPGMAVDSGMAGFYLFSVLFGIMFSLPALIVILFLSIFEFKVKDPGKLKAYFISISIVFMAITMRIVLGGDGLMVTFLYGIPIIVFGLIFKTGKTESPES